VQELPKEAISETAVMKAMAHGGSIQQEPAA
jgi:hypothetical protein